MGVLAMNENMKLQTCGEHCHCFCRQDTGGSWVCCKCGKRLMDVVSIRYIPVLTTFTPLIFPPNISPYSFPIQPTAGGIVQFWY